MRCPFFVNYWRRHSVCGLRARISTIGALIAPRDGPKGMNELDGDEEVREPILEG